MIRQTVLPFKLERTDDTLTAHGGLGLRALVDRELPQPRSHRGYAPEGIVETVILLLQAGGRTLEDLRELGCEEALLGLLGQDALPDPDTVGDWLRRMGDPQTGQAGLEGLGQVRDALTTRLLCRDGVTDYTLDVDATLIEAEKRDAQWSYKGLTGYMPLLGFLVETPVCLVEEFRDGNISPGSGHLAFYQAELINVLEADGVRFSITANQDAAVKALLHMLPDDAWTEPVPGCGYECAEAVHTMNKSRTAFRLIASGSAGTSWHSLTTRRPPTSTTSSPPTGPRRRSRRRGSWTGTTSGDRRRIC
jgi:hypothetical protein